VRTGGAFLTGVLSNPMEPLLQPDEIDVQAEPAQRSDLGEVSSHVSRKIVQLHARLYGRGPTRAKTYITQDYLLSILEEIFTPAERTLIGAGKGEHVQTTRMAFQEAVKDAFVEIVETTTGRPVRTLVSQVDLHTGVAIELFLFEPSADGAAPGGPG
jgi:uncharacterized protein YbcI